MIEVLLPPFQRWLLFTSALVIGGTVSWRGLIAARTRFILSGGELRPEQELPAIVRLERRIAGFGALAAIALTVAWILRLVVQVMNFRDPFVPVTEDISFLVFDTFWGTVWMVQGAVALLLVAGFVVLRSRAGSSAPPDPGLTPEGIPRQGPRPIELPLRWKLAAGGAGMLLLSLALSSHAMSVPFNRPLAVSVDFVHTGAAAAWMGALALILAGTRGQPDGTVLLAAQLRAFSPVAIVSVGLLLFMGIVLSGYHVHEIPALWESRYGRTLLLKIGVALGVLGIGLRNWRRGLPAIGTGPSAPDPAATASVRRAATLEVALAAVVLLVTAVLVATPVPPGAHDP